MVSKEEIKIAGEALGITFMALICWLFKWLVIAFAVWVAAKYLKVL